MTWLREIEADPDIPPNLLLLAWVLQRAAYKRATRDGWFAMAIADLTDQTHFKDRWMKELVHQMIGRGYLEKDPQYRGGRQMESRFRLKSRVHSSAPDSAPDSAPLAVHPNAPRTSYKRSTKANADSRANGGVGSGSTNSSLTDCDWIDDGSGITCASCTLPDIHPRHLRNSNGHTEHIPTTH